MKISPTMITIAALFYLLQNSVTELRYFWQSCPDLFTRLSWLPSDPAHCTKKKVDNLQHWAEAHMFWKTFE